MDEQLFSVVFRGEVVDGHDPEEVKAKLAVIFKTNPENVEKLFSGKPVVIANRVDGRQAQRYKDGFEKAGARCEIRSVADKAPERAERREVEEGRGSGVPHPKKAPCPKCGVDVAESPVCPECGIIIEKYLKRQSLEREETEIPAVETVSAAKAGTGGIGANRKRLLYLLLIAVLIPVTGLVVWKFLPNNPPKDRLLELANRMMANTEIYRSIIEGTNEFSKVSDYLHSGQAKPGDQFFMGMTFPQYEQAVKLSLGEASGALSVRNIEATLKAANVVEDILKTNEAIQAEMDKLKDAEKRCTKDFKPVISGLQNLHESYSSFTILALTPSKQKNLASYCGDYIMQKSLMASRFVGWVKLVNEVKEPPESPDRWIKEYRTALAGIQKLRE